MRVPKVSSGLHKSAYAILSPQTLTAKTSPTAQARISIMWWISFLIFSDHSSTALQKPSLTPLSDLAKSIPPGNSGHPETVSIYCPAWCPSVSQQSSGSRQIHTDVIHTPCLLLAIVDRQGVLSSL